MESGYIEAGGPRLYFEIEGQGDPLIMLNGGPGFPHDYLQETRALATSARLVYFDQRGTGRSAATDPREYTVDANVEDVERLRRALGLGPCGVFGHSWGGMLAQSYALKYPDTLRRLILADTFSSVADVNAALGRMRSAMPAHVQAIYDKHEAAGLYRDGDHYPEEYQSALDLAYEPVFLNTAPPEYLLHSFAKLSGPVYRTMWGEESEFRVTGTLQAFDVHDRLGEIHVPTLVLVGTNDMPTVAMAEATARDIPGAELVVFEQSRHFPFIDEKARFLEVVAGFLRTTASGSYVA